MSDGVWQIPDHEHTPASPPFCDECVRLVAEHDGLRLVYSAGSALDDQGKRVYWVSGDYVDPVLLDRAEGSREGR